MPPRKKYVIRVRAEIDQFLLSCTRIETFITWLHSLFTAIDLALPLDERPIPQDHSVPRSRRRRHRCQDRRSETERHEALVRQQVDIMRTHYPNLAGTDSSTEESDAEGDTTVEDNVYAFFGVSPTGHESRRTAHRSPTSTHLPHPRAPSTPHRSHRRQPVVSALTADGKWRPEHGWCSHHDMLYAKRCMSVLTSKAPHKSKLLVLNGKQYHIDWSTGDLTSLEPPAYNGKDQGCKLKIGRYGQILKF